MEKKLHRCVYLVKIKETCYPSESFLKGSKMPANPGMITPDRDAAFYESRKDFLRSTWCCLQSVRMFYSKG
ncbi:MAG: hypothetical protein IPM85_02750 [Chitinophagaceae bacterium]|nr:hypothetical protein [Chitinophagaceae bacterium]